MGDEWGANDDAWGASGGDDGFGASAGMKYDFLLAVLERQIFLFGLR